jgi:hypothetical protein
MMMKLYQFSEAPLVFEVNENWTIDWSDNTTFNGNVSVPSYLNLRTLTNSSYCTTSVFFYCGARKPWSMVIYRFVNGRMQF